MTISILPRELSSGAQIGESFGTGLSSGLSQLINQYTTNKMQQMQAQQLMPGLQKLLNLQSPEEAGPFAHLAVTNPKLLEPLLKQRAQTQFPEQGSDILSTFFQGASPEQIQAYKAATPGEKQAIIRSVVEDPYRFFKPQQQQEEQQNPIQAVASELPEKVEQEVLSQVKQPSRAQRTVQVRNELLKEGVPPKEALSQANKIVTNEFKEKEQSEKDIHKNEEAFVKYYDEQKPNFDKALTYINNMKKLLKAKKIKGRNLLSQIPEGVLSKWGGVKTKTFQTPSERLFDSNASRLQGIEASLLKGPVSVGKINLAERQKPSIDLDPETNLGVLNELEQEINKGLNTYNAIKKLVSENKGKRPKDLSINALKLAESKGKKLAKVDGKFVEILENGGYRELPEDEAKELMGAR